MSRTIRRAGAPRTTTSGPTSACVLVLLFFGMPLLWILSLSFRNAAGDPRHDDQPVPDSIRRSTTTARC